MILSSFQEKIYELLKANEQITWSVFDYVPKDKEMPFILIGEDQAVPFDTKTSKGKEITTTIDFWGEQRSLLQMKRMVDLVEETLAVDFEKNGYEFEYQRSGTINVRRESPEIIFGTINLIYHVEKEV